MIRLIIFVVLFFVNFSIDSQTIITDRPDQTESSSTIPEGSLQIETGILFGSFKTGGIKFSETLIPSTLFRYGIMKGIELRFVLQLESLNNKTINQKTNGISDLEIGAKFQILKKEDVNTEIAFLSHLILPTASKTLSNNRLGFINKLSISHAISNTLGIGYNVGYDYFGTGKGNFTYSLAFGIGVSDRVGFFVEPYGTIIEFDTHEANFDAGFTYLIKDSFQLDASFGTGINYKMNFVSAGMSINISKKKKQ